ncbi:hypothetical protein BOH72_26335 [Mycobacterium sp. WY10]|nr:hypothetical protein BOH72_26335 [Mycobacterium sp. WY10]
MFCKFTYLKALHGVKMTGSQYRVLVTLLDYADESGHNAFPSVETLATDCDMTDRNIKRCLAWLREHGWIVQRQRGGRRDNGQGWASVYDLAHGNTDAQDEDDTDSHGDIQGQSTGHPGSVMGTSVVSHGDTGVTPPDPVSDPESDPVPDPGRNDSHCQDCEDAQHNVCMLHYHSRHYRYRDAAPCNPHSAPNTIEVMPIPTQDRCMHTPCSNAVQAPSKYFCADHLCVPQAV